MKSEKAEAVRMVRRNDLILARAAARHEGYTLAGFVRMAVVSLIEATIEDYASETGAYDLPLTQEERAALTCDIADYCAALRMRRARQAATDKADDAATA